MTDLAPYAHLSTPHVADACMRLGLPVLKRGVRDPVILGNINPPVVDARCGTEEQIRIAPRTTQRQPHRTTNPLPRHQEDHLNQASHGLIASLEQGD